MRLVLHWVSTSAPPLALCLALSGCAGELAGDEQAYLALSDDAGGPSTDPDPTDPSSEPAPTAGGCPDVAVIFEDNCSAGVCHDAEDPVSALDLASPGLEARLVDVPSTCGELMLIDSADPAASFLLQKLGTVAPDCGSSMPLGGRLDTDDLDCIEEWVDSVTGGASAGESDGGPL